MGGAETTKQTRYRSEPISRPSSGRSGFCAWLSYPLAAQRITGCGEPQLLVVVPLDGHLLSRLMINVNLFLAFLLDQFVSRRVFLDLIVGHHRLLRSNRGFDGLGRSHRRGGGGGGWRLDDSPGVIYINNLITCIAMNGHRV